MTALCIGDARPQYNGMLLQSNDDTLTRNVEAQPYISLSTPTGRMTSSLAKLGAELPRHRTALRTWLSVDGLNSARPCR